MNTVVDAMAKVIGDEAGDWSRYPTLGKIFRHPPSQVAMTELAQLTYRVIQRVEDQGQTEILDSHED